MIQVTIKTNGTEVFDSYDEAKPTMKEVALMVYRLEEIKLRLMSKEFESKFEVSGEV